jgi:hypothetical protein
VAGSARLAALPTAGGARPQPAALPRCIPARPAELAHAADGPHPPAADLAHAADAARPAALSRTPAELAHAAGSAWPAALPHTPAERPRGSSTRPAELAHAAGSMLRAELAHASGSALPRSRPVRRSPTRGHQHLALLLPMVAAGPIRCNGARFHHAGLRFNRSGCRFEHEILALSIEVWRTMSSPPHPSTTSKQFHHFCLLLLLKGSPIAAAKFEMTTD